MTKATEAFEKWGTDDNPEHWFQRRGFTAGYEQGRADLLAEIERVGLFHFQTFGGWQQCIDKTLEEWREINATFLECDRSTTEPTYLYRLPEGEES